MAVVGVSGTRAVQKIEQKRFLLTLLKKREKEKALIMNALCDIL
jgi:hypothetical protein